MKITGSEIIKSGERELLDAITADLDWGAVEEIFIRDHGLEIEEDIEYQKGDIVSYQGQIAYQLQFSVKVGLSILLDREGNYLSAYACGQGGNETSIDDSVTDSHDKHTGKEGSAGHEKSQEDKIPGEEKDDLLEALTELDSKDF